MHPLENTRSHRSTRLVCGWSRTEAVTPSRQPMSANVAAICRFHSWFRSLVSSLGYMSACRRQTDSRYAMAMIGWYTERKQMWNFDFGRSCPCLAWRHPRCEKATPPSLAHVLASCVSRRPGWILACWEIDTKVHFGLGTQEWCRLMH